MNNISVAIIAHAEAQATFDRHLKFWEAIHPRPMVYAPIGEILETTHPVHYVGHKGRATNDSIHRMFDLLKNWCHHSDLPANERIYRKLLIFEYDSICLHTDVFRLVGSFHGIPMMNHDPRFIAPRYLNPPWLLDWQAADAILAKAEECPWIREHGEVDRWISAMAHLAGVPMLDYAPRGFSRGTIGHEHLTDMRVAIYDGAAMIHGIKHEVILNEAVKYHEQRRMIA